MVLAQEVVIVCLCLKDTEIHATSKQGNTTNSALERLYVDEVSCGQKRSFQSVPKGSQEVDLLNRRGAP